MQYTRIQIPPHMMNTDIEDNITLSIEQMRLFTRLLKDMKYFQTFGNVTSSE